MVIVGYGIPADHIYKLGFGFLGKKVWVVSDPPEKDEKDQSDQSGITCGSDKKQY